MNTSLIVKFSCWDASVRNSFLKLLRLFVEEQLPDSGAFPFEECVVEMDEHWIDEE